MQNNLKNIKIEKSLSKNNKRDNMEKEIKID